MPSPNKEEMKLEPRTTHVPKVGHEKNPKGYEISHKTWDQSTQPSENQGSRIPWHGMEGERYGLEDWTNSKFEISICGSNANIRMSYKPKETVYPGVEPKTTPW